jgi:uroporphyrinogen decarboxylase
MKDPDYVPILFFNKDKEKSDIILIDVINHFGGKKKDISEWGFEWKSHDKTMGQPTKALIRDWKDFKNFIKPDAFNKKRFDHVEKIRKRFGEDRYYIASLVLTGFTIMTFLRGFSNTLADLYSEPKKISKLADMVFSFEENIIKQLKEYRFDAVAFYDDWGTQDNLIISPEMWREFFKPRYEKQFKIAHQHGLDIYFHSCGYIYDIITDFIEIGVDMLNLSQPNIFDIKRLSKDFSGKVCFVCPVSYQTTSITGTKEDIYNEVQMLVDNLGNKNGGLIGYVEEYGSIGLSEDNYNHCINAFEEIGNYKK